MELCPRSVKCAQLSWVYVYICFMSLDTILVSWLPFSGFFVIVWLFPKYFWRWDPQTKAGGLFNIGCIKNQTINLVSADSAQNGPSHLYNQQYYNKSVRPKNILKDLPFIITLSYWFVRFTQKSFYLLNKNCKNILLLGMISWNIYWASVLTEDIKVFGLERTSDTNTSCKDLC